MPAYLRKDLDTCMRYFFNESQPIPHSALSDAICVSRLCEKFAKIQGYDDFNSFLHYMPQFLAPFELSQLQK